MNDIKGLIVSELEKIDRNGIKKLIKFMDNEGFFVAPASANYHLNCKGGLAKHSWNVFKNYKKLVSEHKGLDIPLNSIRIQALCHDLCKIDQYKIDDEPPTKRQLSYLESLANKRNISISTGLSKKYASALIDWLKNNPNGNRPEKEESWVYDEERVVPLGHGEKSVMLLQSHLGELTVEEVLAIRWHMGPWESGVVDGRKNSDFNAATGRVPDVYFLHLSDYLATAQEEFDLGAL